ncbi:MAG: YhcH/YjgK/YiaL family protein [bacterium]|nr:YhcH/YjgK/YiaL family protein [bacterium]
MILDDLSRLEILAALPGPFDDALAFLRQPGLETLEDGRYEAGLRGVHATVSRQRARHAGEGRLEAHRRHADIQVLLGGRESIGWAPLDLTALPDTAWDPAADVQFFAGAPQLWLHLRPGQFAVFLPADLHLSLVGEDLIHKIVVKVPLPEG